ncbi:MAG: hypothetical protein KGH61_03220 [Candidatus Micrarchaeota archaeon]|nr:hypothetical protein [Candidatus Micrarchaeota archaeon]MDE1847934.1 hypothetical protein [Candidatus Micrarchaeota archaeon]MDE1864928.1 hypothetical protein [Candidatus Micrarchaeota archaeon]
MKEQEIPWEQSPGISAYLVSYGWIAVVAIIAIVILLKVNIFGGAPQCVTQPGFLCEAPAMNTSGGLKLVFGQIVSSQMVITSVGCSSNETTLPDTTPVEIPVISGQMVNLNFNCTSTKTPGLHSNYLWVTYNTGSADNLIMQFGEVETTSGAGTISVVYPPAMLAAKSNGTSTVFNMVL